MTEFLAITRNTIDPEEKMDILRKATIAGLSGDTFYPTEMELLYKNFEANPDLMTIYENHYNGRTMETTVNFMVANINTFGLEGLYSIYRAIPGDEQTIKTDEEPVLGGFDIPAEAEYISSKEAFQLLGLWHKIEYQPED